MSCHERGKKQRRRREKEKARRRLCDLSQWWLGLSRWRGYEAITKALQMHPANLLTWKIKQGRRSVPLKTLRYMAAFVILMGQVLNWDMLICQWFQCKSSSLCDDSFNSLLACVCLAFSFSHTMLSMCVCVWERECMHASACVYACSGWYMSCGRIERTLSTAAGCHSHLRGPMSWWELMYSDILWDSGSPQRA